MSTLPQVSGDLLPLRSVKETTDIQHYSPPPQSSTTNHPTLTRKQKKFVEFFLRGMSCKQAALTAGYSASMAENASVAIRKHPTVAREIQRRLDEDYEELELTTKMIENNNRRMAEWNLLDYGVIQPDGNFKFDLRSVTREQAYAIQEVGWDPNGALRLRFADKKANNEMLGKFKKMGSPDEQVKSTSEERITAQLLDALVSQHEAKHITINNNTVNITNTELAKGKQQYTDNKTIEAE